MEKKYHLVTISGIHTQIALFKDKIGYTEGVLEVFLPSDEEAEKWSDRKCQAWIKQNNKRMESICNFLNRNNL